MYQKLETRDLILIAFMSILGLFSKRIIGPFANSITDFFRIPGGSLTSGFSFLFLLVGIVIINKKYIGSYMGVLQGVLAIFLGISSFQGIYAIVIYGLPGIVMDLTWYIFNKIKILNREDYKGTLMLMGAFANVTGSILTNIIIFRLQGILLILWFLISIFSGAFAGLAAEALVIRLKCINLEEKDEKE